jgi:hypothetical protein
MKFKLSKHQKNHLENIIKFTTKRMRKKFYEGARDHGGDLLEKDCLNEAFDEVIDLMVYLRTELLKRGK